MVYVGIFGQFSQAQGCIVVAIMGRAGIWTLMIFGDLFQLGIFSDSVTCGTPALCLGLLQLRGSEVSVGMNVGVHLGQGDEWFQVDVGVVEVPGPRGGGCRSAKDGNE